jgi:hypothetical protein
MTEIVNAEITDATIRFDRDIFLCAHIGLSYGDSTYQGFGGLVLGGNPFDTTVAAAKHADQPNIAADFIGGAMAVAGVDSWSKLPGRIVRVKREDGFGGKILAIGHATKDRWLDPAELPAFKALEARND